MYIDTHCHISKNDFDDIELVINNIGDNIAIISGADNATNHEVIDMINHYPNLYGTIGIHPSEINDDYEDAIKFIEDNISHPKIVGIGEIGLDYHFGKENIEKQKSVFITQIELALKYHKPIVIHSRDAASDTYDIIRQYPTMKKVMHCYSYSLEMAKQFEKINVVFGIGGVATFKNSKVLKQVIETIDITNMLLETDSPYLAPEPIRGTKNEPKNIPIIAAKISEIKNIPIENVLQITTNNAIHEFDLKI